jgi:hypothetical protein
MTGSCCVAALPALLKLARSCCWAQSTMRICKALQHNRLPREPHLQAPHLVQCRQDVHLSPAV